jgi:hypothetical protein
LQSNASLNPEVATSAGQRDPTSPHATATAPVDDNRDSIIAGHRGELARLREEQARLREKKERLLQLQNIEELEEQMRKQEQELTGRIAEISRPK